MLIIINSYYFAILFCLEDYTISKLTIWETGVNAPFEI